MDTTTSPASSQDVLNHFSIMGLPAAAAGGIVPARRRLTKRSSSRALDACCGF
ncbi:MAG: hypothetical protein M3N57_10005 [Actinomycetota bacterium]|nr:hypothetical protein [Actinomycetota bacterium]